LKFWLELPVEVASGQGVSKPTAVCLVFRTVIAVSADRRVEDHDLADLGVVEGVADAIDENALAT